jgi:hypothetical protein
LVNFCMLSKRFIYRSSLVAILLLAILGLMINAAAAQTVAPPAVIQPTSQLTVPPPQLRTWAQMEAAARLKAAAPAAPAPKVVPFRPTIEAAAYENLKAQADQSRALQAPAGPAVESPSPQSPTTLTNPVNFDGVDSVTAGGWYPPDTHGAVGPNHFVEITNSHLDIYEKAAPNTLVKSVALSDFFGYYTQGLFDVRAYYDHDGNRWLMSSDAFAESTTVQRFFFAVSQTADPLGTYYIYNVNVSDGNGPPPPYSVEWDFPQMGLDHNALIFTANFFDKTGTFVDARMFAVPKSQVYSGQTFTLNLFKNLLGSLTPPVVLDTNPNTYLLAADTGDNKVSLYTLTNTATEPPTLSGPATIPVDPYAVPPSAPQPGTTYVIDTSDCRFVNAGPQIGNSLFQVHTINVGGYARPRFYEFDPVNLTVRQSGTFSRSSTSYDFNASIAANGRKDLVVTWSATDPTNGVNAEVRFSGRLVSDPQGVIPSPGSLLYGSAAFLSGNHDVGLIQRWGDYSAVSFDPADPRGATAWIVNERILGNYEWGSRIGAVVLPFSLPAINYLLLMQ